MPKAQVNDIRMYYEERGEGFPLVLIMGLGCNLDWWGDELWDALASQYRVVAFDNRGAGRTDAPKVPYSIAGFAADTIGLMDALDIAKAHVFGVSMGGMIAQEVALRYADRVEKLVLGCTCCGGPETIQASPEVLQILVTRNDHPDAMKAGITKLLFPDAFAAIHASRIEEYWKRISAIPTEPDAFYRQLTAIQQWGCFDRLPNLQAPTLILHGTDDILVPPGNAEVLANRIPNATVKLYEGTGHGFTGQMPQEVAADVLAFLGR
jgi:pimeloyl-ACP methyl ester carboxylesterase